MLSESVVSTLLQASITGAGLMIAIYALITPISRQIFGERVEAIRKKKEEFDKVKTTINSESSKKDINRLTTLATEIKNMKTFPKYLGFGVLFVFTFYIIASVFAWGWLTKSVDSRTIFDELAVSILFAISTFGFLLVGGYAILDVWQAMRKEFEEMTKEKEEVEKAKRELESRGIIPSMKEKERCFIRKDELT